MKKCPYCAEDIQDEAIKCKHCGEFLDHQSVAPGQDVNVKWYFRGTAMVIAFLCVGPLMLPMVWWHPRMNRTSKIIYTLVIVAITALLYFAMREMIAQMMDLYSDLYSL